MEDAQIVELFWQRDDDAIRQSSAKYGNYCYAIASRILSDHQDAEECVNDTWLCAWNAMPEHRPDRLTAFLGKLTRRLACNRLRDSRASKRGGGELPAVLDELTGCIPTSPSAAQVVEDRELERLLNQFLYTLPQEECDLFLRRYWFADPLSDISARYGKKLNTVKTSLFRTRQKLKHYLEQEGITL